MVEKTKFILEGEDRTRRAFRSVRSNLVGLERAARAAQSAFIGLLGAGAIGGAVKSIANAGIALERIQRGLRAATGSAEGAASEIRFLREESERLGLNFEAAAESFTKFSAAAKGTALEGQQTRDIFTAVAEASRVMGLSAEQTRGALTALEQIISKGTVSAEELRGQLGERIPGAFQIAARSIGVTTEALDDMLRKGELTAERLLPALAQELRNTFGGEVENAANDAQAAFNRFQNSVFELQAAFANSGLLDSLASAANFLADIGNSVVTSNIEDLESALEDITQQMSILVDLRDRAFGETRDIFDEQINQLANLAELTDRRLRKEKEIERQRRIDASLLSEIVVLEKERSDAVDKAIEAQQRKIDKLAESFVREFSTAEEEVAARLREFDLVAHMFPPDFQERVRSTLSDSLLVEELDTSDIEKLRSFTFEATDKMSEFVKQGARNIQTVFADFLFDPFEDGLDGMLKGFANVLRRMAAEAASAQIFQALGGIGLFSGFGGLGGGAATAGSSGGSFFGLPGFANGGAFTVGGTGGVDSQLVQFMASPGERVTIDKPGQRRGGGIVFNQNVNVEAGANLSDIDRFLRPVLAEERDATLAKLNQMQLEGRA